MKPLFNLKNSSFQGLFDATVHKHGLPDSCRRFLDVAVPQIVNDLSEALPRYQAVTGHNRDYWYMSNPHFVEVAW